MGCGASVISQAEFDQVRREAEEAKTKVKELEQLVAELKAGQSRDGTAVAETATDVAELQARLESQLRDARREIKELQSQLPTTQSSGNGNGSAVKPSSSVGGFTDEPPAYESTGPKVGDKVISHWVKWQFYPATIHSFDPDSLTFTVDFDDGDTTGREQKVEHVAVNKIPDVTDVGVGSIVFFPQGRYAGSGDRQGGTHWHLGKIVHVSTSRSGEHLYSGEHVKGEADGKWVTYKGYNRTFENLPLSSLRVSPNVFDLLQQHQPTNTEEKPVYTGEWPDVFISFSHANCSSSSGADNAPPAYSQMESVTTDPRRIKDDLRARGFSCWDADDTPDNGAPEQIALAMRNCKVVVACISNEYAADSSCRTQFQFAKKMLKKPVVPIIVGAGAWDWQATVVGLLIAGELFISFQDQGLHERKMEELIDAVSDLAHMSVMADAGGVDTPARNVNPNKRDAYDVFVSYCWNNSITAESEHNITRIVGNLFNDPRHIKKELTSRGYSMWLDVEQIEASGSGLFEDITQGLTASNCVLAFISQEYAMSDNCRLEFQFALKSLHKPVIPVVVGNGEGWQQTAIGFLSSPLDPIFMVSVEDETSFYSFLSQISARLEPHKLEGGGAPVAISTVQYEHSRVPEVGVKVISHWQKWQFYTATITKIDKSNRTFTIAWDDGDTTGLVQPFHLVAVDSVPPQDEVGVGSLVFFQQGRYVATDTRAAGYHWHLGVIDRVYQDASGMTLYDGHHDKGAADGKWVTFKGYNETFTGVTLSQLRMPPNVMDILN
eukprot:m.16389 g.16389  ORF g.16389 m.16389 type:complete len:777 (-) comp7072_c0_seq2:261-2591(-)